MFLHVKKEHNGDTKNVKISFKVLRKHRKPLERQLDEAVNINRKKPAENLNTKYEFNSQNLNKMRLERLKESFQCNTCAASFETKAEVNNHKEKFHIKKNCAPCNHECFGQSGFDEHMRSRHKSQPSSTNDVNTN